MFLAILICAAAVVVYPFVRRRFAWGGSLALAVTATLLYFVYESQMPPEMNIRVDLLVIYPALAFAWLFSVGLAATAWFRDGAKLG